MNAMIDKEQFKTIVERSVDGLLIVDREGLVRFINPSAASMLGRPVDELLGFQFGFPSDSEQPVEIVIPGKNKESFIVELRSASITWNDNDAFLVSLREISDLKKAQAEIRLQKNFAESLIETAQTIILLLDPEGRIIRFNSYFEELTGYHLEEVIGEDWFHQFVPEAEQKSVRGLFAKAMEGTLTRGNSNAILKKDGSEIFVEWYDKLLKDETGKIIGLLATGRDMTIQLLTEKALLESRKRHKEAQKVAHIGHWIHYPDTESPEWSEEVFHIFGLDPAQDEPTFAGIANLIHPDDWPVLNDTVQDALKQGKPFDLEFRIMHPEKGIRWMHVIGHPVTDQNGCVTKLFGTAQDITEQKKLIVELQESRERYQLAVDGINDGIWDRNLITNEIYFSPRWKNILGYEDHEIPNRFDEWKKRIHTDDVEPAFSALQAYLDGNTEKYRLEHRLRHKDGSYRWILSRGTCQRDANGKPVRMVGSHTDITERKKAEEELRKNEQLLRDITENMFDMVTLADMEGHRLYSSPSHETILGYPPKHLFGRNIKELIHPEDLDRALSKLLEMQTTLAPQNEILRYRKADGQYIWIETLAKVIQDDTSQPTGMIFSSRDITARKRAEEERTKLEAQLHQSQKMESIGRLAGGVAHDFNNLLTVINGYADFIYTSLPEPEPMRKDAEEILKAADSASSLTNQLLTFSRKQFIVPKVINLNKAVIQSEKMLQRLIGEDIELCFVPDEHLGLVKIDPGQISQILVNLAVNARDAMPRGGKLTIETRNVTLESEQAYRSEDVHGDFACLAVSDNGEGIPEEIRDQIFEPFFTTKPKEKGTGLGLSTIYGIVLQNEGYINVYTESDQGTTFKIYLPLVDMDEDAIEAKEETVLVTGEETILLVEDQETVRQLAARILSKRGYKVIEAADGMQAEQLFAQTDGNIDLLLTDVVMPQMSGKQLYDRLNAKKPGLPVLYMSGYTDDAIDRHGILDKSQAFLAKPFTNRDLALKVREVLDVSGPESGKQNQVNCSRDTVLLIDDEEQFHNLFARFTQGLDMHLIPASSGEEGLAQFRKHGERIAIIFTDLNLPDCSGADLIEQLTEIRQDLPILLVSGYMPDEIAQRTFPKGKVICSQKPTSDLKKWFCDLIRKHCDRNG